MLVTRLASRVTLAVRSDAKDVMFLSINLVSSFTLLCTVLPCGSHVELARLAGTDVAFKIGFLFRELPGDVLAAPASAERCALLSLQRAA